MLDRILNWARRALAVAALAAMFLPLVTTHGCNENRTYTGCGAVWEGPALAAIPLFFAAALALTLLSRRARTAIGRLVFALFKIAAVGAVGAWTGIAFGALPDCHDVSPETGGWIILAAAAGILACDAVEAARRWAAWRRWKREHAVPFLDDRLVRRTAWGLGASGAIPAALVLGFITLDFDWSGWVESGRYPLLMTGLLVLAAAAWALARLAAWGLRRGLGWAKVLHHAGAYLTLAAIAPWTALWASFLAEELADPKHGVNPLFVLFYGIGLLWLGWTLWTVHVLEWSRRRLFPSRKVKVAAGGQVRRIRIPCCPACGNRLWLAPDASHLVCRPCGKTFAAEFCVSTAISTVIAIDTQEPGT
jgi:hypothetical protein